MNIDDINTEIVRALKIDAKLVRKIVITLEAGAAPTVEVHKYLNTADGFVTAVEMMQLVTQPHPSYADLVAPVCNALNGKAS